MDTLKAGEDGGDEAHGAGDLAALSAQDWAALRAAVEALDRQSLARTLNAALGRRMKRLTEMALPRMSKTVAAAVNAALKAALRAAIGSLGARAEQGAPTRSSVIGHRAAVVLSGAAGGAFGMATLPIELPLSTTIMLRSIAEIARGEGEDLSDPESALACIEVFALGGASGADSWESGYFAVRAVLAKAMGSAAIYMAGRSLIEESAPALARYLSLVAARFGAAVTQKLAAQAVPIVGAAGGAVVNYVFLEHFQRVAEGHFAVRRLERLHGPETVRKAFEQIRLARAGDHARPVAAALKDQADADEAGPPRSSPGTV